jgi:hypothetical protein
VIWCTSKQRTNIRFKLISENSWCRACNIHTPTVYGTDESTRSWCIGDKVENIFVLLAFHRSLQPSSARQMSAH